MRKVRFNKYIKAVGVEFEGFYNYETTLVGVIRGSGLFQDPKGDGSLDYMDINYLKYKALEVVTHPLGEEQLNTALGIMHRAQKAKDYVLNSSCGLHYHISLNKNYYAYICSLEFYRAYLALIQKVAPEIARSRWDNHYCTAPLTRRYSRPEEHFTKNSPNRYQAVNYCYQKHGTVEFRLYGGGLATVAGLSDLIRLTIKWIGETIEKREQAPRPEALKIEGPAKAGQDLNVPIIIPGLRVINRHYPVPRPANGVYRSINNFFTVPAERVRVLTI